MADDKEDKGFTVVDKRIDASEEETESAEASSGASDNSEKAASPEGPEPRVPKGPSQEETDQAREAFEERREAPTQVDLATFLLSLHTSALIHLGVIPNPMINEKEVDLPLARQNIDLLEMLQEKTRGNRTEDEDRLLDHILYELRMAYIEIARQATKG